MGPHITSGYFTVAVRYTGGNSGDADTLLACETGKRIVVTSVRVSTDFANSTTVPNVQVFFATGVTKIDPDSTPNDGVVFDGLGMNKAVNVVVGNGSGIIGYGAKNENLNLIVETPSPGAVSIIVSGYQEAFDTY